MNPSATAGIQARIAGGLYLALSMLALVSFNVSAQTQFSEFTKVSIPIGTSGAGEGDTFGNDLAIDGDTMVVGAYELGAGAAFVYVRNANGAWTLQQMLSNGGLANYIRYGSCVGVSGNTIIVGAPGISEGVFVYTRSGSAWTQQALLSTGVQGGFGQKCRLAGDYAIVMAPNEGSGTGYVFNRAGVTWTQQAVLGRIDSAPGGGFGDSVDINGSTIVVGLGGTVGGGSLNVFVRSGTTWSGQQKIVATDGQESNLLGASVAINGDTIVAGATGTGGNVFRSGGAYVFTRSGGVWTQQQKLLASDPRQNNGFGSAVAIENDTAIIGSQADNGVAGVGSGSAYVFRRVAGSWTEAQKVFPSDILAGHHFGFSAGLSNSIAVLGAVGDNIGTYSQGSAYVFVNNPTGCTYALNPAATALLPASGGAGAFNVTTQPGCRWQATVQDVAPWVTSTDAGTGNGTANFIVAPSSTKARRAEVHINGGQTFWVNQASSLPTQQGDIDAGFGNTGLVTSSLRTFNSASGLAIQPNGKIVVVGQSFGGGPTVGTVVRYNANGTLDTSFNGTGVVLQQLVINPAFTKVALQADGKIVVAGTVDQASSNQDFLVVRYLSTGLLDTSFGTGGIVRTDMGANNDRATAIKIAPDGKIVVAGLTNSDFYGIARYNIDGTLDTSFDGDGIVISQAINSLASLAVQADGKILVIGSPGVFRYNVNGSLDTTFDGDGFANVFGRAIAIQTDDKIVAGSAGSDPGGALDFAVTRLNPNGSIDTGFGTNGTVKTNMGIPILAESYTQDILRDIVVHPNGKIIAAGSVKSNRYTGVSPTQAVIARYNADGTIDTTFGSGDGIARMDFPFPDTYSIAEAVALQPNGGIVIAGVYTARANEQDIMVMRLLGEGPPMLLTVSKSGTGSGTVASVAPGISCGADCSETYTVPGIVALTAMPDAGSVFTGWLGACTGRAGCNVNMNGDKLVRAVFAPDSIELSLDIDGNHQYDALTDGLLLVRQMLGVTGDALVRGAIGSNAKRATAAVLLQLMINLEPLPDVDGDGRVDVFSDGMLIMRYMFGLRGPALTAGATSTDATRTTPEQIEAYMKILLP